MTSDTRDLTTTEQPPRPPDRVQLSAVQVAASTLASLSAAVVASLFGVAGTVIGAGVVAVISTTGSAIYSASMKRTSNQLRRAREQLLTARATEGRDARGTRSGSTAVLDAPGSRRRPTQSRTIDLTDTADTSDLSDTSTQQQNRWHRGWLTVGSRRGLKWPALVGAVALVFAITIGAITAFEAITQKPISSLTGHNSSSSTTIGSLTEKSTATPTKTPSSTGKSGSGSDAGNTSPSAVPSATSSRSSGSTTQSEAPTSATPRPATSAVPSSAAPQPSSAGGTGGGSSKNLQVPAP